MTFPSGFGRTIRHATDAEEKPRMHMAQTTRWWTLAELHRLPDDGNKYELIHGELFVTPGPTPLHESIIARLHRLLDPYVVANSLGMIYRPRAVIQVRESEVEPDLMVRDDSRIPKRWNQAPTPILVVEVLSDTTRRRDHMQKRDWYLEIGVPEYWIIDPDERTIRVVRPGLEDVLLTERVSWLPSGASSPFELEIAKLFD